MERAQWTLSCNLLDDYSAVGWFVYGFIASSDGVSAGGVTSLVSVKSGKEKE